MAPVSGPERLADTIQTMRAIAPDPLIDMGGHLFAHAVAGHVPHIAPEDVGAVLMAAGVEAAGVQMAAVAIGAPALRTMNESFALLAGLGGEQLYRGCRT